MDAAQLCLVVTVGTTYYATSASNTSRYETLFIEEKKIVLLF